jgi:hypothetical protein
MSRSEQELRSYVEPFGLSGMSASPHGNEKLKLTNVLLRPVAAEAFLSHFELHRQLDSNAMRSAADLFGDVSCKISLDPGREVEDERTVRQESQNAASSDDSLQSRLLECSNVDRLRLKGQLCNP